MATVIRITGADFSANSVGFIAPISSGLLGWWYLGGSVAETQQDRAGIANATLSGSPTIGNGYVSFGGFSSGQYLTTAIEEVEEMTALVVARSTEAAHSGTDLPMFVSNFAGSGVGFSIYISDGTVPAGTVRIGAGQDNNGTLQPQITTNISVTDASVWNFYAARLADTSSDNTQALNERKLFNKTTAQTNSTNNYPRVVGANVMRIGAGYTSSFTGSCDVAFAAFYDRALSDAEVETVYQSVKDRLAGKHSIAI